MPVCDLCTSFPLTLVDIVSPALQMGYSPTTTNHIWIVPYPINVKLVSQLGS